MEFGLEIPQIDLVFEVLNIFWLKLGPLGWTVVTLETSTFS